MLNTPPVYEQSFPFKHSVLESGSLKNYSDNDINTIAEFWRISSEKLKKRRVKGEAQLIQRIKGKGIY